MASRKVVLTGASGGLGKVLAENLLKASHQVVLCTKSQKEILESKFSKEIKEGNAFIFEGDLTLEENVLALKKLTLEKLGKCDVLINNAGVSLNGMVWKYDYSDWKASLDVNLSLPFLCIKHFIPIMKEEGWGRVVNISSVVGQTGVAGTSGYSASKAGLIGLTKTVAKEVSRNGITVNCISLGYFEAGMLYEIQENIREIIKKTIPQEKFGDPNEISCMINYLMGDDSSYCTGQVLNLNGGLL